MLWGVVGIVLMSSFSCQFYVLDWRELVISKKFTRRDVIRYQGVVYVCYLCTKFNHAIFLGILCESFVLSYIYHEDLSEITLMTMK